MITKTKSDDGTWVLYSKDVVYSTWGTDSWSNESRSIYNYDDYSASVRHFSSANKTGSFKASINTVNNYPVVNLAVENSSDFVIELFDMQGKTIGKTIRKSFSAGTHSVTLKGVSQGNYICRIFNHKSLKAVPFKVVR